VRGQIDGSLLIKVFNLNFDVVLKLWGRELQECFTEMMAHVNEVRHLEVAVLLRPLSRSTERAFKCV
jgi:hypothetical protein